MNKNLKYKNIILEKIKKFLSDIYKTLPFTNRKTILRVLFSYFILIFLFTILIMSPISWNKYEHSWNFLDSLFITTSAFTTTGLSVRNIGFDMTIFGQVFVFLLIIFGGLGLLFFKLMLYKILFFLFKMNTNTKVYDEQLFERGYFYFTKTKRMMIVSFGVLFLIQTIGFFLFFFYFYFVPIKTFDSFNGQSYSDFKMYNNFGKSVWNAAFYSISSTNNAGFDLLPCDGSLQMFANEYYIQLVFIFLFIFGGIGFPVFLEMWESIVRFKKKYINKEKVINPNKFLVKFLLFSYFIVLMISLLSIFLSESFNPNSKKTGGGFFMAVLFNTLSTRSAGFSTVDIDLEFNFVSKFLFSLFMWIGCSPLSTGGGIKTTAFIILIFSIFLTRDQQNNLIIKRRSISSIVVNNSFKTFFLSSFFIFASIIIISVSLSDDLIHPLHNKEGTLYFSDIFFYTTSAFGNVGLNTFNIIDKKNWIGFKLISVFLMIIGQIGLINFVQYKVKRISKNIVYFPVDIPL